MYLILFACLIFPHFLLGNEIKECLPCNCSINHWDKQTNAECSTLVGLTGLTDIPETIESNINGFNFLGQSFTILNNNSFSRFFNLTNMYFPRNRIEIIEKNAFKNLTRLTTISLSQNNIQSLPDGVFSDLQQLVKIYINYNKIKILSKDVFSNLPNLKFINIDSNEITVVEDDSFSNLPSLLSVNLSQNKLTTIDLKITNDISKLKYFDFYSNPWNCTITLCPIMDSAKLDSFQFSFCQSPSNFMGKTWSELLDEFPISISNMRNVYEGEIAKIRCRNCFASRVIWQLPIPLRNHTVEVSLVSLTSTLVLENVTQEDSGYYRCHLEGCSTCTVGTFLNVQKRIATVTDSMPGVSLLLHSTVNEIKNNIKDTTKRTSSSFLIIALIIPTIIVLAIGVYIFYHKRIRQTFCPKNQIVHNHEFSILPGEDSETFRGHNNKQKR